MHYSLLDSVRLAKRLGEGSTEGVVVLPSGSLRTYVIYLTVTVTCCQDDTFCDSCMKMQPTGLFHSGSIFQKGPTRSPGQASAVQAAEKVNFAASAPKGASDFTRLTVSLKRYPDTKPEFFRKLYSR